MVAEGQVQEHYFGHNREEIQTKLQKVKDQRQKL